jgi:hypothetical protein
MRTLSLQANDISQRFGRPPRSAGSIGQPREWIVRINGLWPAVWACRRNIGSVIGPARLAGRESHMVYPARRVRGYWRPDQGDPDSAGQQTPDSIEQCASDSIGRVGVVAPNVCTELSQMRDGRGEFVAI